MMCLSRGSGTVLVLALLLSAISFSGMVTFTGNLLVKQSQLQAETDSAAVAANQTLRGLNTGFPCEAATRFLHHYLAGLQNCLSVGEKTRVVATAQVGGIVLTAEAWAQPQP
jgi:hypothetical protein